MAAIRERAARAACRLSKARLKYVRTRPGCGTRQSVAYPSPGFERCGARSLLLEEVEQAEPVAGEGAELLDELIYLYAAHLDYLRDADQPHFLELAPVLLQAAGLERLDQVWIDHLGLGSGRRRGPRRPAAALRARRDGRLSATAARALCHLGRAVFLLIVVQRADRPAVGRQTTSQVSVAKRGRE